MNLKSLIGFVLASLLFSMCKDGNNSSAGKPICDTVCMKDSINFMDNKSKLHPYVYISAKNCSGDTLTWGYSGQNKNIVFNYRLNKDFTRCYIRDTAYALLMFNTCSNGRGYYIKFAFGKKGSYQKSSSAINNFDPKFAVGDSLLAYTDMGNIFVENINTGKQEMMTFGKQLDFDFDAIHETLDSVNISRTRIWAKAKVDGGWKEFEKSVSL